MGVMEAYTRISLRLLSTRLGMMIRKIDAPDKRLIDSTYTHSKQSQVNTRLASAGDWLEHRQRSNQSGRRILQRLDHIRITATQTTNRYILYEDVIHPIYDYLQLFRR